MTLIPSMIIRALCWTLLHSLWQGLILALVAGAVMLLTRKAKSSTRYNLLGLLVLAFLLVSGYTFFREFRTPAASQNQGIAAQVNLTAPVAAAPEVVAPSQLSPMESLIRYFNEHAAVVVLVWLIVALARFVKVLSGIVYAQRIRHYGTQPASAEWQDRLKALLQRLRITRPVRLLESTLVKVPAVVGWLKPIVLVPAGMLIRLSPDQVESILLHELAHISRRDYLFNLVQHLVDTLFFFNPALLWVSALIRTERENCCDDIAIRETRSRRRLIQALVSFHEYQERGYALGFAGRRDEVVKRVERIVHKKNHSLNAGERALLMGGVLLLCGAFMTINGARTATPLQAKIVVEPKADVRAAAPATTSMAAVRRSETQRTQRIKPRVQVQSIEADTTKPDSAKIATLTKADIDLLIRARDHGVTPEYISDLRQMGYNISLEQAIRLMDHGVNADFIRAIQKEGYGVISVDKATQLIDHGVSIDFIRRVRAAGFPKLTLDQAITLVDHGVTGDFIEKWKKKTGTSLELADYIHLRDAGIDPS